MGFKRFILLLIFIFSLTPSQGQQSSNSIFESNLVVKQWNNQTGLPQNTVFDIDKDAIGNLWISTEEGIVRFDGSKFKVYNGGTNPDFYSNLFNMLSASPNGGIWASNPMELVHIDSLVNVYKFKFYSNENKITCFEEDKDGKLWVGTDSGNIYHLNHRSKSIEESNVKLDAPVNFIKSLSNGLLIGTTNGLYEYLPARNELKYFSELGPINITAITVDNEQSFWIGSQTNGLFHIKNDSVIQFAERNGLKENFIIALDISPTGEVLIGTSSSGLQVFKDGKLSDFQVKGFDFNDIKSIFFYSDNLLWIGTSGSGLYLLRKAEVQEIPEDIHLTGNVILPIFEDKNKNIWIGTAGNGVNKISSNKIEYFSKENGLSNGVILSIYGSDEAIYIGTANGLNEILLGSSTINKVYTEKDGLASNIIKAVYFSSGKTLWIATRSGGIHYLNGGKKIIQLELPEFLTNAEFNSFFEDMDGNIWIGTKGSGLLIIDENKEIKHVSLTGRLRNSDILSFYEDDKNTIWIGTDKGLIGFNDDAYFILNKENGLKFSEIYNIIEDHNNFLWLSGNQGLQNFHADELERVKFEENAIISVRLFNANNGMKNEEANGGVFPAGWRLSNGNIWFPTVEGIAVIDPDVIEYYKEASNVYIEHIKFANQVYTRINNIQVPSGTVNIEIEYSSINFTDPGAINYFYRIKELDMDWENVGNRRVGYFTILEPGEYTFEVKSELFGAFSKPKAFSFAVVPFFYQTLWFKAIILFSIIALSILALDYFYRRKKGVELADLVERRTSELKRSNEKLKVAFKDIEEQNIKLKEIAWIQSHIVRAPLARLLGVVDLLSYKKLEDKELKNLFVNLKVSGEELDSVIRDIVRKSEEVIKDSEK